MLPLILNIETATKNCSVSLTEGGRLVTLKELNEGQYSHSEKLHLFIRDVLEEAGKTFSDLSAVAVSKGPGSYTGLRIGVSTAKGLCFALDLPMISVPTLQILAMQAKVEDVAVIVPLIDARRMEVYSAVFNSRYQQVRDTEAEIINSTSFKDYLAANNVYFLGDGADKCKEIIQHPNAIFLEGHFPSAKQMAVISFERYKKGDFEDVAYFEPFYLKDFVAGKPKS